MQCAEEHFKDTTLGEITNRVQKNANFDTRPPSATSRFGLDSHTLAKCRKLQGTQSFINILVSVQLYSIGV